MERRIRRHSQFRTIILFLFLIRFQVDQILRQSAEFWINFVIIIDQLCKMKTHTERLLQYSISNPQFAKRFFERLDDYRQFWTALRDHSKHYVLEAQSKMRALNEFALAIESTAVRIFQYYF